MYSHKYMYVRMYDELMTNELMIIFQCFLLVLYNYIKQQSLYKSAVDYYLFGQYDNTIDFEFQVWLKSINISCWRWLLEMPIVSNLLMACLAVY